MFLSPHLPPTINHVCQNKDNNFNLIRILCAWGVLAVHSFALAANKPEITDPLMAFFGIGLGTFFVTIFFAISGFLICRSLDRSQDIRLYAIARIKRLLPGLICALALTTFLLGPLLTSLSTKAYFQHPETWTYLLNINLLNIHTEFNLPGVFSDTPYPNTVNGSIWTLPFETWMYVMTAVFFCCQWMLITRLPASQKWLGPVTTTLISLLFCVAGAYFTDQKQQQHYDILMFICTFFIAASMYKYRQYVPLSWPLMVTLLAFTPWLANTIIAPAYVSFSIVYSTLVLAYRFNGWIRLYNKVGDYSYGLYIYAFPVQQTLAHLIDDINVVSMIGLTTLLTLPLAILSWHFIEKPFMAYRRSTVTE